MFEGGETTTSLGVTTRRIMESIGETVVRTHEETRVIKVITNKVHEMVQNLYCLLIQFFRDLFQITPRWFQICLTMLYEKGRQYPLIVDFFRSFIVFFAVPLTLFLSWSIGSILLSGITFAAAWTTFNIFSIITGLISVFPFFIFSLFSAIITTFVTTIGRLTIISGKHVYRATLMFFRHHVWSGIGQETDESMATTRNASTT
ncbi:hypothetical protein RclHR1_01270026 [Rhizophagus clarus]|uniref:Uncharacterized protein n=1 Tax=Rhizophagus clarus TaxID=94130 RepID=A0A2Z6Q7Y1_9GLOM|nr:hypothetical protein RclHR1_01270026 [Rhizophagus clarus]GET02396.1 hypothetical protein GLOIN_2v1132678 [Rhizophagus clarus]